MQLLQMKSEQSIAASFGQHPKAPQAFTGHDPPPRTVSGPNRSRVESSTEHEVWKLMVWPLIETSVSALNEPWIVNCPPSETDLVCPFIVTEADAGKVLVRAPYALLPWLLELTPWPAVYKNVSDDGRFLLLLSQMVHLSLIHI